MNQYQQLWRSQRKGERTKQKNQPTSIWIGWEQTLSLIYSNISEDLKGKLATNQFTDTQVRAKNQQKTKRYCADCRIYYRSWTFFTAAYYERKQLWKTEEDANNLPRSPKCSSLSQIQLGNSNPVHAIIMLCGRRDDQSKFTIKRNWQKWRNAVEVIIDPGGKNAFIQGYTIYRGSEKRALCVPNQMPDTKMQCREEGSIKLNQIRRLTHQFVGSVGSLIVS